MKKETYKILCIDDLEVQEWTLDEILYQINGFGRSNEWTDYDETDWKEGWKEWVEHEGFYILLDERGDYEVIDAEEGDDFQQYTDGEGNIVPKGTPVGIEYADTFYIFSHIFYP